MLALPINESNQMIPNNITTLTTAPAAPTAATAPTATPLTPSPLPSLVGQLVWAPRNAGELIYWPATVVSAAFESMDASMSSKIQSVQIQYYGPPSQLATVPIESLQLYGRGELAEQHVQSVVNPVLVQLLEEAITDANNHINKSVTLSHPSSANTSSTTNNVVPLFPSHTTSAITSTTTTSDIITPSSPSSSSVAAATSTTPPSVMATESVSVTKTDVAAAAAPSEASSSQVSTSSSSSSSSPSRLPPGLHVRILQPSLMGQIGVILHAPVLGTNEENYTVRALFNNLSYQLPRHFLEEWEHGGAASVNAAITQANASGGATAAATAAAAISAAHQAAQAAMFSVYQQHQQQQSFATAEPYIGQAVRVTKGDASGRTGTIIAWQPEYYAFRVRLGSEEVLKRNDELELLTAPMYRSVLPQQPAGSNETSAFHPVSPSTTHIPPAHTPAASTRAQQPVLVTPATLSDKKRKANLPRSKSVRNLVGKYVMIEAGRYKGEVGFVAKGGNGYYGVIKLPGPNDPIIETQPVMKRSADLSLIQLTPEQRAEHERGVAKYFPHLVPPPSSPTLDSAMAPTASPVPLPSESSSMAPSPLPSASPSPSPLTIMTGSPARSQRQPVSSPTPSEVGDIASDEETVVAAPAPSPTHQSEEVVEEAFEVVDKVSKKKRKAQVTAVTKTESWVDRRVLVTVGKYRGEVGTIVKSGHGFYCVDIPNRGEVMKRAAELELYDVGGTIPVTHGHAPASDAKVRAAAFILIDLLKDHQAAVIQSKRAKLNHDDTDVEYEEPMTTVFGRPAAIRKVMATAQVARETKTPVKIESSTTIITALSPSSSSSSTPPLPTSPSLMGDATSSTTSVSDDNEDIVGVDETHDEYYSMPSSPAAARRHARSRLTLDSKKAFRPRYINAAGLAPL